VTKHKFDQAQYRQKQDRYASPMSLSIKNRCTAGRYLASALEHFRDRQDVIVLAIPRGGVPVAREISQRLNAPLDVIIVRKLGCPQQPELAFGAIVSGGKHVLMPDIIDQYHISDAAIDRVVIQEQKELLRREQIYRGNKLWPILKQKTVILVDDGLATGATMRVAIAAVREQHPAGIVVAVPVASAQTVIELRDLVDDVICLATPEPFISVGQHYQHFDQVTDREVCTLLSC